MKLHCPSCKYFKRTSCGKTGDMIENGFAMMAHSRKCGEKLTDDELSVLEAYYKEKK